MNTELTFNETIKERLHKHATRENQDITISEIEKLPRNLNMINDMMLNAEYMGQKMNSAINLKYIKAINILSDIILNDQRKIQNIDRKYASKNQAEIERIDDENTARYRFTKDLKLELISIISTL